MLELFYEFASFFLTFARHTAGKKRARELRSGKWIFIQGEGHLRHVDLAVKAFVMTGIKFYDNSQRAGKLWLSPSTDFSVLVFRTLDSGPPRILNPPT